MGCPAGAEGAEGGTEGGFRFLLRAGDEDLARGAIMAGRTGIPCSRRTAAGAQHSSRPSIIGGAWPLPCVSPSCADASLAFNGYSLTVYPARNPGEPQIGLAGHAPQRVAVPAGSHPPVWRAFSRFDNSCLASWYSSSAFTSQRFDLERTPATILSTAVMAVSME
jgi:hypothetical protein